MPAKFQLAIGDTLEFPVTLTLRDGGATKDFKFKAQARRIDADELRDQVTPGTDAGERLVSDVLRGLITGWRDQKLVIDEDGNPADFSVEALDAMLAVSGAAHLMYSAYVKALIATAGPEGARKN